MGEAKITELRKVRDGLREDYDALCQKYREQKVEFQEISSKRIATKKRVAKQKNENTKQTIEMVKLDVTMLSKRVDTHNDQLVAAAQHIDDSDSDDGEFSMASNFSSKQVSSSITKLHDEQVSSSTMHQSISVQEFTMVSSSKTISSS